MADTYSCLIIFNLFFYSALFLPLSVYKSHGARHEPMSHHKEMKSLMPASASLTSPSGGKFRHLHIADMNKSLLNSDTEPTRNLGEYGDDIVLTLTSGDNDNFLVTVGFGTPKRDFTLLFDTGSDLTWIPCQSCGTDCNTQVSFNPSSSSTFSNASCDTPTCDYDSSYNDGSSSTGYYARDTLTMTSDQVPNFLFGCAQKVTGDFGGANGVLGVGKGNYSLIAQTDTNFFSTFCYCLPRSKSSSGYIVFGVQAFDCQPEPSKLIPIVPAPNQRALTSYYITLAGITIGQKRLDIASYTSSSSVKAIIDSGTIISRLPSSLYSALSSAFQEIMSQYRRIPSTESSFLDTCYDLGGQNNWTPPNMALHFDNVDVNLDSSAATTTGKSDSEVCLAFAGNRDNNDLIIIGNQQHRALNLFFNTKDRQLGINSDGCIDIIIG